MQSSVATKKQFKRPGARVRASFTLENVFLIPLFTMIIVFLRGAGLYLHDNIIIKNALIQGTVILEKNILKEAVSFFSSRLATGILDMVLMWLFVYFNVVNDVIAKVIVNVIVVVLNYVLSKLVVFKGDK